MAKAVAARSLDIEAIDRLEEKLKMLVNVVERLRTDSIRLADENSRLSRELDGMRSRLSDAVGSSVELTALREERDLIRARVGEMLQQIEALDI